MNIVRFLCCCSLTFIVGPSGRATAYTPFAVEVIEYAPAPGQFVNNPDFNDPAVALGAPVAGGFTDPGNSSLVTLGGFGGTITLRFSRTVLDDPLNPLGMDAIVFGNAFWAWGQPEAHWAECATMEICRDVDGDGWPGGAPDEPWYLIAGSHIPDPQAAWSQVCWDDDFGDNECPPSDPAALPPDSYGQWMTAAFMLPTDIFGAPVVINPSGDANVEGIFGYAEYSPTLPLGDLDADNVVDDPTIPPELFYTVPDDPLRVGITPGSGGGDAFDIAWAIDPATKDPAPITGFDFIRITTAVLAVRDDVGEKSAEIDAVADVAPDPFGDADDDADIDLMDIAAMQACVSGVDTVYGDCTRFDADGDELTDKTEAGRAIRRMTGPR